ncbi:hypothetical protein WN982_32735 [Paraburkholderia sp. IMGN_8]
MHADVNAGVGVKAKAGAVAGARRGEIRTGKRAALRIPRDALYLR